MFRLAPHRAFPLGIANPSGRPKVAPELRAAAQEVSIEGLKVLTGIMRDEKAPQNARINAVQAIWDRGFGKPDQQHRVSGQINFAHLLAEYTQLRAIEEAGEVQVLDVVDGHAVDDTAPKNGSGPIDSPHGPAR